MRISLTFKWVLTLLLSSLIGIILTGLFGYLTTIREFDRFVNETAEQDFIADVTSYYASQESWQGINAYLHPPRDEIDNPEAFFILPWAVVGLDGRVISGAGPFRPGDIPPPEAMETLIALQVDGETVGYALNAAPPEDLSPREQEYLNNTNRALFYGALGASLLAVLVGLLLSRQFLHPLTELTEAITKMKSGDLDQQVRVKTNDELGQLAEAFNQMSAELHRANQLRKQMTADVAHDLRTPLHVMSGYIEAMRDGSLHPTPERFNAMQQEANLLKRLVEDLRVLSLADSNALKLQYQTIHPQELLEQIKDSFVPLAEQEGVTIRTDIDSNVPEVQLDRERMIQVLSNLVSNALRYTPEQGTITLCANLNGDHVALSVQDTGAGIAEDQLADIFERFYRGDKSRHEVDGESGLGLAIVKSIVEAHSGTVQVVSNIGSGTTFTILLPKTVLLR